MNPYLPQDVYTNSLTENQRRLEIDSGRMINE